MLIAQLRQQPSDGDRAFATYAAGGFVLSVRQAAWLALDEQGAQPENCCRQTGGAETSWNSSMTCCGRGYEATVIANLLHIDANVHLVIVADAIWQISLS